MMFPRKREVPRRWSSTSLLTASPSRWPAGCWASPSRNDTRLLGEVGADEEHLAPGVGDVVSDSVRGVPDHEPRGRPSPRRPGVPSLSRPRSRDWRPSPSRSCRQRDTSGGLLFWWLW